MLSKSEPRKSLFRLARPTIRVGFKNSRSCYMLPTDNIELDRQASLHYIHRQTWHGNFQCPLEEALEGGIKVIDVSCGNGIWTLEMARAFPNSTFVGTDVADIFPQDGIPPNCSFVRADTLKGLPFDSEFDFTFQRMVYLAYTPTDWEKVVTELVRVTKKGGWIELVESDGTLQRVPPNYQKYTDAWLTATSARGIDVFLSQNLSSFLTGASLTDIESDYASVAVGWDDRAGELLGRNIEFHRLALKKLMAPLMEMTEDEYERWAVAITRGLGETRTWVNTYYAYGRKR